MPRVVILGAGTGVGKTWVTVALVSALRECQSAGQVLALKPVESGLSAVPGVGERPPPGSDAALLEAAGGWAVLREAHPLFGFLEGISPHLAAARSGQEIELPAIQAWVSRNEAAVRARAEFAADDETRHVRLSALGQLWCFIETAGGAFSPLSPESTNVDLAVSLNPDVVILVAPDRLGVLHDVGAVVPALKNRGVSVQHIILSQASLPDPSTGTNLGELQRLRGMIGLSPLTGLWSVERDRPEQLSTLAEQLALLA